MRRLLLALVLVTALAGSAYAYVLNQRVTGPLTGLPVSRDVANRRPIAVTLDNFSPDARPQSGLSQASLVFETLAEGGITRYMAIYLEHDAPMIGPVRSTRLYFNSWAAGLGVIFGHDGGNVDALEELPHLSTIFNADANRIFGPFWRITQRAAPHNEYTSTARLRSYAQAHGASVTGSLVTLPHKDDAPFFQRPGPVKIDVPFSYAAYEVVWRYDPRANDYLRWVGGNPDVDATTGTQLRAKNFVVMYTSETPASDPYTPGSIHLGTEGSGHAVMYLDGTSIDGTWSKSSVDGSLQWLNSSGQAIKLDRGNTWVEIVPNGTQVSMTSGS